MVDNSVFQPEATFGPASNREPSTRHRGGKPEDAVSEVSSCSHDNAITKDPGEINGHATDNSMADERIDSCSKRKLTIILIMCTVTLFLSCTSVSIIYPFFPLVAQTKGMSQAVVGVVFGSLRIVFWITVPLFASFMTKLGPKNVYMSGIVVGGVGCVLSGPLDKTPDGAPFIATVLICRCVQSIGFSAINMAGFTIISNTYPNNIGTAFGVLHIGLGLGYTLGPLVGGALYQVGGYGLPFYVVGGLVLVNGLLVFKVVPPVEYTPTERKGSMLGLLRSPMLVLSMGSVLIGVFGISTYEATLATHMEQFELSTVVVSLFFVIVPGLLVISSPLYGYISDMRDLQSLLIIGGHLVSAIGFLLLGPSELLPFVPSSPGTIGVALAFIGMSFGCAIVPTMKCMVMGALELKYEDNIDTYAFVSGLHNLAFCIGSVVGPIGSSALIGEFGHRVVYTAFGLVCVAMMLVSLVFFCGRNAIRKRRLRLDHQNNVV